MFRRLKLLFEFLLRRRRLEDDLDEELRSSFEIIVDRFVEQGRALPEARRAARIELEGFQLLKERVRDELVGAAFHTFLQDLCHASRELRRRPSFALVA